MMDRVRRRFDLQPQRLADDTAYGAVRLLKWLVDRSITPHIPVWDKSARRSRSSLRMRFICANRISTFLRSRRYCWKASVLANARRDHAHPR
jgi:hypothetical protein